MEYIYSQIDQYLKMFPEWLQHLIAESGVDAALDSTLPCLFLFYFF
jgi:glucose-6-phosphate isomerase